MDEDGRLDEHTIKARLLESIPNDGNPEKSTATIDSGWAYGVGHPMPDDDPVSDPAEVESGFTREVEREARRLRVRQAAQELVTRERTGHQPVLAPVGLAHFLAQPDEDACYRVQGLWPTNGRVVMSAQHKAGKTTLTGNLIRSLADGEPFLDTFAVERASRTILVDNELSPNLIRRWLRDQSIETVDAVDVVPLRGRLSSFDIIDPVVRSQGATALGEADVLIFDCLRPSLDALGLSEDKDAGRFLEALDELIAAAGIMELLVVHHMGHTNERSRGDSRILDWPDAVWKLVRDDTDDPRSDRYFAAYGRDVDQPEVRLWFNQPDRHLVVNGGSRRDSRTSQVEGDVLAFVGDNPGCSQTAIEQAVIGDRTAIRNAARHLVALKRIRVETAGQTRKHWVIAP